MFDSFSLIDLLVELGVLAERPPKFDLSSDRSPSILELAEKGLLDEVEALTKISKRLGVEFVDLESVEICSKLTIGAFTDTVNADTCSKYKLVPLYEDSYAVFTAFVDPLNTEAVKMVEFSLGKPVRICLARENQILALITEYFPRSNDSFDECEIIKDNHFVEFMGDSESDQDLDQKKPDTAPIIKLCNKILSDGVQYRASDIHVEPSQTGLDVRFRIDGKLWPVMELPKRLQPFLTSRMKLLAGMDIAERRRPQDGRMRIRVSGQNVDIRVSSVPVAHGEKLVLRLLKSDFTGLQFGSLGMQKDLEASLCSILKKTGKILLVTGPTGSGKTTTLYTCLRHLTDGVSNIQTVEDPVEYRVPGINQIQVNESTNVTFLTALRSILRQDPDIIMIGEIRDGETAQTAFQAAQTGHFVLSTLHTNNAPSAVTRLLDLGVPRFLLSSSLAGVLAQRLIRQLCPNCKKPADAKYALAHYDSIIQTGVPDIGDCLMVGNGCEKCGNSGYLGRVGIFSLFEITNEISIKIHEGASLVDIVSEAGAQGFKSLHDAAIILLREGLTSLDEVAPYLKGNKELPPQEKGSLSNNDSEVEAQGDSMQSSEKVEQPKVDVHPQSALPEQSVEKRSQPNPPSEQSFSQGVPPQQQIAPSQPLQEAPPSPQYQPQPVVTQPQVLQSSLQGSPSQNEYYQAPSNTQSPQFLQPLPQQIPQYAGPPPAPSAVPQQQVLQPVPQFLESQIQSPIAHPQIPVVAQHQFLQPLPLSVGHQAHKIQDSRQYHATQPQISEHFSVAPFTPIDELSRKSAASILGGAGEQSSVSGRRIKKQTVVLVEDNNDIRSLLSILLRQEMFEVIEAENGLIGLERVYQHNPIVVLCDLMMPIMDGRQFIVKMKSNQETKNIPIIILTSADEEKNEVDLITLGATDFISKSSSSEVMLSRLRKAIHLD